MLTPQEIHDKKFEKAVFGGYDMTQVDDFLDSIMNDYSALYKENAILKAKLKVLVDKVEEYRSVDDAMRRALLSAQNMANELVQNAKRESESLVSTAHRDASMKISEIHAEIAREEKKLIEAKAAAGDLIERMIASFGGGIDLLKQIRDKNHIENPVIAKPSEEPEKEKEFEILIPQLEVNPKAEETENIAPVNDSPASPAPDQAPVEAEKDENIKVYEIQFDADDFKESPDSSGHDEKLNQKPRFSFENLQFGKNYEDK